MFGYADRRVSATTEAWWRETSALSWRRLEARRCAEASYVGVSKTIQIEDRCESTYGEHRREHQGNQEEDLGIQLERHVS
jgi:hypothetical protein